MSFQGDVGGIGLADLLQSLARGREGVLTLIGRNELRSTLGIQGGLVHLLPEPEEDPEIWRNRARQAWVKDPDFRIDTLRMTEIARAQRIENLYMLLDSDGVHFRFAPGPIPERPSDPAISASQPGTARPGVRRDAVFCAGMSVEGLLLEYARMQDEFQGAGGTRFLSQHAVLEALDPALAPVHLARFAEECDGFSNLSEIADRLGWPLRQLCNLAQLEVVQGNLRLVHPTGLLMLAARELLQGNFGRASSRLEAWIDGSSPGPLEPGDAEFLANEWQAGRLQTVLRSMPKKSGRRLLLRLDLALQNPLTAVEHWTEFVKVHREDALSLFHLMTCQVRSAADSSVPSMRDLLSMGRSFSQAEQPLRAAAVLRVAAARQPEATEMRLAVGLGLVSAGFPDEGGPWILEAARTLIQNGHPEQAIPPLRALIDAHPSHRAARRLLSRARASLVQRSITKKNSLVTLAVILALSVGAVVQFRNQRERKRKLSEVTSHLSQPREALRLLDEYFGSDDSSRIQDLRASLEEHRKSEDNALRTAWTDRYRDAQLECTLGDPLLGLQRALALPPPPVPATAGDPWPLVSDLFNGLRARLENSLREIGKDVLDTPEQTHAEQRLTSQVKELAAVVESAAGSGPAKEFAAGLSALLKQIEARDEERAEARAKRIKQDNLQRQDELLATARAHAEAHDWVRALAFYQLLLDTDKTGKLKELLAPEITKVASKAKAIQIARELALAGKHDEAKRALTDAGEKPEEQLLSWKIESFPPGARAKLMDNTVHRTPFRLESALDEKVEMTFDLEGHEPQSLSVTAPGDHFLYFSRIPERAWHPPGLVEALPVAVGEDHVVCDRAGSFARLSKNGNLVWHHKLTSLGGIARAPVFLPKKPGFLLLLTEDGEAFIVDAASGSLEGPWSAGMPPIEGPISTESGVVARFYDGSLALWDSRLKPEMHTGAEALDILPPSVSLGGESNSGSGSTAGLCVLRKRNGGGLRLDSPWTEWTLSIGEENYSVSAKGSAQVAFTVHRSGECTYVAWEAPHTLIPKGRLWISDGKGLRAFTP